MAAEASSALNGVYDTQYGQPAELAASTPSQTSSQTQSATSTQQKADPQEIGWYFVEQYYTTLSRTPERIHLFYSKKSQLITGVEAEKVVPAVGARAISEKIKALDIQDCKVRVLNVDSQSSFENIVVQVIGEMSNRSQPPHKFVQTFVLATQPNGYFVLNDIFRYLNEEEDEILEDQPEQAEATLESVEAVEDTINTPEEVVDTEQAVAAVDDKLEAIVEPAEEEKTNGVEAELPAPSVNPVESVEPTTQEPVVIPSAEQPLEPEPTPVTETAPKLTPEHSTAPPAKKTWASLVGNKAPAIPAIPALPATPATNQPKSQRVAPSAQPPKQAESTPAPQSTTNTPAADEWQTADHGKKTKPTQPKSTDAVVHAYIKNVTEKIQATDLRHALESFGELKYFDVSRPRSCAFVEFADAAGYAAAVAANPHEVNGESITVEERRPRPGTYGNNPGNFNRGGSNANRGRGAFQNRGGSQGNAQRDARGGFQQRGGKSGNVTPRGRGQAPAA